MNINKAEFLELVKAESVARKSTAVPTEREKLRKQLNRDVKKFLKSGGQVEQLPGTELNHVHSGQRWKAVKMDIFPSIRKRAWRTGVIRADIRTRGAIFYLN